VVTALAFGLWYFAVNRLGSDRAGVLIGLMPVSGLVTSVLLGAQQLTLVSAAGAATVALGCVIGLRKPPKPPADSASDVRPRSTAVPTAT
jgi:drug/metabolite transporter (DMT)-like permease